MLGPLLSMLRRDERGQYDPLQLLVTCVVIVLLVVLVVYVMRHA